MIRLGAKYLAKPIKYLINMSINTSTFPNDLKAAEVSPIYKKNNRLDKCNYRPVSILPCISKIFESVYVDQLSLYFESLFAPTLSGFRKAHNCQHVLIDFIEKCKSSLDNNKVYGAIELYSISQYIGTPGTDVIAPPPHHIWNCFGLSN